MMENEVDSDQVWDPRKSVASGRWRGWGHAENSFLWKILSMERSLDSCLF